MASNPRPATGKNRAPSRVARGKVDKPRDGPYRSPQRHSRGGKTPLNGPNR